MHSAWVARQHAQARVQRGCQLGGAGAQEERQSQRKYVGCLYGRLPLAELRVRIPTSLLILPLLNRLVLTTAECVEMDRFRRMLCAMPRSAVLAVYCC